MAYWQETLAEGPVKKLLNEAVKPPADAFFSIANAEVVPLVEKGDTGTARNQLTTKLEPVFAKHHAAIEAMVKAAVTEHEAIETALDTLVKERKTELNITGLILLGVVVGLTLLMRQGALAQQRREAAAEAELSVAREREQQQAAALRADIASLLGVVDAAAKGDLTREVAAAGTESVALMGDQLRTFLSELRVSIQGIARNAQTLSSASGELSEVSQRMTATAQETSAQASTVSAASEQVSQNVQTVAAGTEEMSASIREIARNAAEAARVASSAVSIAANANSTVAKLGESSSEVGKVIKVITAIAQQTKMLALNATVEAARAGEAGKGFAVVANEVKELAKETARATEEISQKIEAIQTDTRGAVAAIGEISNIIGQINSIQTTIAGAVEEQTATTNEMSRNVSEGAKGTNEIAQSITGVAKAARDTSEGAAASMRAAKALSEMASELERLVGRYTVSA